MLIVSIHDVTPALEPGVRQAWDLCRRLGIVPALLVVPDWHGGWPVDEHPAFVAWIRRCTQSGSEVLLHGERHDEVGLPRRLLDHARAWGRTAGEGEFLTLDRRRASVRIERGLERLRSLGLGPSGFVPPAWLAREATFEAARELGLSLAEDVRSVRLLDRRERRRAPVIRWSTRTLARRIGSVLAAEVRRVTLRHTRLLRIGIHPPDLAYPATAASVERSLRFWRALHTPGGYRAAADATALAESAGALPETALR